MLYTLNALRARHSGDPDKVAVLAPTGLDACAISGTTPNRWSGLGLGCRGRQPWKRQSRARGETTGAALTRWRNVEVIIIDEISMVDGRLFDLLFMLASRVRKDARPLGVYRWS